MERNTQPRACVREWSIHMVTNYKWELRKGGGKDICPNCGQRRFVPYVSAADHTTMAGAEYGRCDREQSCGYHKYPNGKETPNTEPIIPELKEPLRFHAAAVQVDLQTNLFTWVAKTFGMTHAMNIWKRYKIGRDGSRTVFWQIAIDGSIRAGKSIPYNTDGHRDKSDKYPANWLHKSRVWDAYCTGEELQQCFFGEHLLRGSDKPVMIVESEKTAAIMSELSNKYIWLASGGSQGLKNEDKNKVLKGREVSLLPDNGQYWNWKATADKNGWHVLEYIEKAPLFEGCDILDYVTAGVFPELLKNKKQ